MEKNGKTWLGISLFILASLVFFTAGDAAAAYPNNTIQIICQFPPGGATDQFARFMAAKLETILGQKVIVQNRAGGGGTTGTAIAGQAKPDGYTLTIGCPGPFTARTIVEKVPYSYKEFDFIAQLCFFEEIAAVKIDAPWKTMEEFISDAKKNPGKYSYSTSGAGAMGHILMETVKYLFKIDVTHVPFKGGAPALTAMLGDHVTICASEGVFEPHLKAKTIRKLFTGVSSKFRTDNTKNFEDLGHDISIDVWYGLAAPKGMPKEVTAKLAAACKTVYADEVFKKNILNIGGIPAYLDADEFSKKVEKHYNLFKTMLDRMGLSAK